ncbi:MAG: hypothetical protein QMC80_01540 [Thermoplasmatales archaeon]|nr:hypothetical protein [Thermoplasmatales archaeon]
MLEKHGWNQNPFNPNLPEPDFLIYRRQTEEIFEKIRENRILWICAPMGSGKTTILKYIVKHSPAYNLKTLYWHCGYNPELEDFKIRCKRLHSFFDVLKRKIRVILIDEANYITDRWFFRYLVGLLDDERIHPSVVFASVTPPPSDLMFETFKDRHVENITIGPASEDEIMSMIEGRIKKAGGKGIEPFDEENLREIIRKCETPRMLLERLMMLASGKETEEKAGVEKSSLDLEKLSEQQKRIVEILSVHPMSAPEIAKTLSTSQSGVRGQLNRLGSMGFLRDKGYRMPVVEKRGGVWHIHPEFRVASAKAKQ